MDFDGDTISVILVPEEAKEDTMAKMSPRVNKLYKKNLKNIFEFNHETLEKPRGYKISQIAGKFFRTNQQSIKIQRLFMRTYDIV